MTTPSTSAISAEFLPLPAPDAIHGASHRRRRDQLAHELRGRFQVGAAVILLHSGKEVSRNGDNLHPFRPISDYLYLTGLMEPDSWLLMELRPDGSHETSLFCRPRDPDREIWDGVRAGPAGARSRSRLDHAYPLDQLETRLTEALGRVEAVVAPLARDPAVEPLLHKALEQVRRRSRAGLEPPAMIVDLSALTAPMRLVKDEAELRTMARAASISARAHTEAMKATRPGMAEFEVEAILLASFRQQGAQSVAYPSIVAGGPHSCILHHRAGTRRFADGDLLLIDAGCELDGYASDITRTFPVNGRFRPVQRAAYEIVLAAQEAAALAARPGVSFDTPHHAAVKVLARGLLDLRLIGPMSLDAAIDTGAYRRFYMHRTSHWLGLDVHDVGSVKGVLKAGEVLTIEPGLYIAPAADIPQEFWNIGIRIEDDAVVTAHGCQLITRGVPVEIDEIESLMAARGEVLLGA